MDFRKSYRELAEQIGVSEGEVKSRVEAYRMMGEYKIR
jgi:DNA-binding Lrp family transcriptional regulator